MVLNDNYRILGLDNSKNCTGWAVVDVKNKTDMKLVDYGYIDTSKLKDDGEALVHIEKFFEKIMSHYKPDYISAEAMFAGRNRVTTMVLAHVHGIMLLVARKHNIPITYYSVMTMKSAVLGGVKLKKDDGTKKTGDDIKKEVANKVFEVFGRENFVKEFTDDVTDAISAIITFIKKDGKPIEKKPKKRKKRKETTKKPS